MMRPNCRDFTPRTAAGTGRADPTSFIAALDMARDMARNRAAG